MWMPLPLVQLRSWCWKDAKRSLSGSGLGDPRRRLDLEATGPALNSGALVPNGGLRVGARPYQSNDGVTRIPGLLPAQASREEKVAAMNEAAQDIIENNTNWYLVARKFNSQTPDLRSNLGGVFWLDSKLVEPGLMARVHKAVKNMQTN